MFFLANIRNKAIFLLPIVILLLNSLYFSALTKEINRALLDEKYFEAALAVDMLIIGVEGSSRGDQTDFERSVVKSVEFLDQQYQVYAEVFKKHDGVFSSISKRNYDTSIFDPFDYPVFIDQIGVQEMGNVVIGYTPERQEHRDLHVYFRWLPKDMNNSDQYLIVAGVSQYSVTATIAEWVTHGQLISMVISFVMNAIMVFMLVKLGNIYSVRKGYLWTINKRGFYYG